MVTNWQGGMGLRSLRGTGGYFTMTHSPTGQFRLQRFKVAGPILDLTLVVLPLGSRLLFGPDLLYGPGHVTASSHPWFPPV